MEQLSEFGKVFIYMIVGGVLVSLTLFLNNILAPKRPSKLKLDSYECGEQPRGSSWVQFNTRFYVVALVFLLFDVEMVFIFPWSTVFGQKALIAADASWGWLSLFEMLAFVFILILGLVYVWKKGDLNWIKSSPTQTSVQSAVPYELYQQINVRRYEIKAFSTNEETSTGIEQKVSPKPAFRPAFKRNTL